MKAHGATKGKSSAPMFQKNTHIHTWIHTYKPLTLYIIHCACMKAHEATKEKSSALVFPKMHGATKGTSVAPTFLQTHTYIHTCIQTYILHYIYYTLCMYESAWGN